MLIKIKLITRNSNKINFSLENMDPYGSESNKQKLEFLENASVLL